MNKTLLILTAKTCGPGNDVFTRYYKRTSDFISRGIASDSTIQLIQEIKSNCDKYYSLLVRAMEKDARSPIQGLLEESREIAIVNWTYLSPDMLLRVLHPYKDSVSSVFNPVGFFNKTLIDAAVESGNGASIIKKTLENIKFRGDPLSKTQVYQLVSQASISDSIIVVYEQRGYYGFLNNLIEAVSRYYNTTVHEHVIGV